MYSRLAVVSNLGAFVVKLRGLLLAALTLVIVASGLVLLPATQAQAATPAAGGCDLTSLDLGIPMSSAAPWATYAMVNVPQGSRLLADVATTKGIGYGFNGAVGLYKPMANGAAGHKVSSAGYSQDSQDPTGAKVISLDNDSATTELVLEFGYWFEVATKNGTAKLSNARIVRDRQAAGRCLKQMVLSRRCPNRSPSPLVQYFV
jgi:hypothetical protein